jgi:hypothetical protein
VIAELRAMFRDAVTRPSPRSVFAAATGLLVLVIPAIEPLANVRLLAVVGALVVLASIVAPLPGLPTTACALGIVETAIVTLDDGSFAIPVAESLVVLAYLLVADIGSAGRAEIRTDLPRLMSRETSTFAGGIALLAVVASIALANLGSSFALAMCAVVAGAAVVAVLRWLPPD